MHGHSHSLHGYFTLTILDKIWTIAIRMCPGQSFLSKSVPKSSLEQTVSSITEHSKSVGEPIALFLIDWALIVE